MRIYKEETIIGRLVPGKWSLVPLDENGAHELISRLKREQRSAATIALATPVVADQRTLPPSIDATDKKMINKEALEKYMQQAKKDKEGKLTPVDLWVRAGSDGQCNGADPACQQVFMAMLYKSKGKNSSLRFNVKTVNLAKPTEEFKQHGLRHTPALVESEEAFDTLEDILEFLDSRHPQPSMQYFDPDADEACEDLFSKFAWFIKEVNKDPHSLTHELQKIDAHLKKANTKYLTGSELTHLDCRIAPILQHIRIALLHLKHYTLPTQLPHLWTYMRNIYANDVFAQTCPADQEIVLYWASRPDTAKITDAQLMELQRQPRCTTLIVP